MGALTGFFTIGVLIALGWLLAHVGVLTTEHRRMMSFVALYVASPALMGTMMAKADLTRVFARSVAANYGAIAGAAIVYLVVAALAFRHDLAGRTIGTLLACYSNAGNLGLPVAAYALGDVTWIAPILLIQMALLQPAALAILDHELAKAEGRHQSVLSLVTLPLRNPLTVGVLIGLALNLLGWPIPALIDTPLEMLGGVAIPLMLLAFGISLRLDPKPGKGRDRIESWFLVATKVVIQPVIAFLLARYALRLDPTAVHAVTIVASLPPAQNIFVFASRFEVRMVFARDTIFRATLVAMVVIVVATSVLL